MLALKGAGHGGALAPAFLPSDIAGLEVWCRPETLGADTTQIAAWDNEGSGADLAQASATERPLVAANVLDGFKVARFDGGTDHLFGAIAADASRTVFIVLKQAAAALDRVLEIGGVSTAYLRSATGANWEWLENQAAGSVNLGGTPTSWQVVTLKVTSAASMSGYINGGAAVTFDPNDSVTTGTTLTVGASFGGSGGFGGDVAEVIGYTETKSDGDKDKVLGYLSRKFPTLGSFGT